MTVFERIKSLAKNHSKTMKQVTFDLNYSENYFYTLKNGKQPSAEKLNEIADYFGVSVDYLLGRTDNPQNTETKDEYDDLVMMFRKNEMEIPEDKRDEYRREVEKLMEFVKFTMKELDEKNKNK